MPSLVSIETAGRDHRARRLVFSDTSSLITAAAVVRELGLDVGHEVETEELEADLCAIEARSAHDRALRVLEYRERSVQELSTRLRDDGYPAAIVQSVVDRMVELALVDDSRFARLWARSRAAAGIGRSKIARELASKGVHPEYAAAALDEALEDTDEVARATIALHGRTATDRKQRDKLLRRLVSRGYDISTALKALEMKDDPDD